MALYDTLKSLIEKAREMTPQLPWRPNQLQQPQTQGPQPTFPTAIPPQGYPQLSGMAGTLQQLVGRAQNAFTNRTLPANPPPLTGMAGMVQQGVQQAFPIVHQMMPQNAAAMRTGQYGGLGGMTQNAASSLQAILRQRGLLR